MLELKALLQPHSLGEALELLDEHGDTARPLAGGTSLIFSSSHRLEVLVDLSRTGLDGVSGDRDQLRVGAMVTLSRLWAFLKDQEPRALWEAARGAGSRVLQNHITVGGNCVQVYAWSDLPVALLALDARVVIQGREEREFSAREFYNGHPVRKLGRGELLTAVLVPRTPPGEGSAHVRFVRTRTDHPLVTVAARVRLDEGGVAEARVAVGAVRGLPQLAHAPGLFLVGKAPDEETLAEAGRRAAQEVKVTADIRITSDYRRHLVQTLVADALGVAARRAGGEA